MINEEQVEKLNLLTLDEWPPHKDVVVAGNEKTALLCEGQWYLIPINFKFGNDKHPGQPFLSMDGDQIEVVTEEYLNTLPVWDFEHEAGIVTHNGVVQLFKPGIEPVE